MNCCNDFGVCTKGSDCPCGDLPVATVPDPTGIPTRPLGNELDLTPYSGRKMVVVWVFMLAFGAANLVVICGALGYLWGTYSTDIQHLFWTAASLFY